MSELPKINMSKEDFEIPAEVTEELVAQGEADSRAVRELEGAVGPVEVMMGEAVLRALNEENERLEALDEGESEAEQLGVLDKETEQLGVLGEPWAERRAIFTSEAKGKNARAKAKGGKRLAAPEKKGVIDRLKQVREDAGYVGKRVLKATELPGNANVKNAEFTESEDADEAALEAAFREVTLDEVLAEEEPGRKTPMEQVAEKLGRAKVAEIIIGAIGAAREQEGNYYDYLQGQADDNEVPYEDLLQLVREQVKAGYDERKEKIKFYYSLGQKEFAEAAKVGKLRRKDAGKRGADHRASDLKFSQDFMDEGEVTWTGFEGERGAQSDEVTLVFGGDLIDEPSFDALMLSAVGVDEVDLQEKCLAVVSDKRGLEKVLARNSLAIPVEAVGEGAESWQQRSRDADALREKKAELVEQRAQRESLRREAITEVNMPAAHERMQKEVAKIKPEDWDEIFEQFQGSETDAEYEAAEKQTFAKMLERLGVKGAAEVRYLDENSNERCYLTAAEDDEGYRMWIATLSRKTVPLGSMSRSVEVLGHEADHAQQVQLIDKLRAGKEMTEKERALAEKYAYNLEHFTPFAVDPAGYNKQILEVDATLFGEGCADAFYERYEENHKTPMQKVAEALQELLKRPEAKAERS